MNSDETAKLFYYGEITQNTNEDWKNVNLSLSTTTPSFNSKPPELSGVTVRFKPKEKYFSNNYYQASINYGGGGKPMQTQSTTSERGTLSSTYSIPNLSTIPSDDVSHRIFIGEIDLKPKFSFYAVPRLSEQVYAKMNTDNESDYQLLPGQMSIFYNNDYVSKSKLKVR